MTRAAKKQGVAPIWIISYCDATNEQVEVEVCKTIEQANAVLARIWENGWEDDGDYEGFTYCVNVIRVCVNSSGSEILTWGLVLEEPRNAPMLPNEESCL